MFGFRGEEFQAAAEFAGRAEKRVEAFFVDGVAVVTVAPGTPSGLCNGSRRTLGIARTFPSVHPRSSVHILRDRAPLGKPGVATMTGDCV
jgi:hypothetical protein